MHIGENFMDRNQLIEVIKSYGLKCDLDLINKAINYAIYYHQGQKRESGEDYANHPLEVAEITARMELDTASIVTAILHDTVEDTSLSLEDISREFGEEVAKLVDGVTKLAKLKFEPEQVRKAENFRKLFVALSDDLRVLLVKLADRLHNMRTIEHVSSHEKRMRVALETREIYGSLAERIGMQNIKLELQDRAFEVLHPEIRESILNRLEKIAAEGRDQVEQIIGEIKDTLKNGGIEGEVYGRKKTPWSIWQKMKSKNVSFEQLSDIIAFRVIVNSLEDCYRALGALHNSYKMVPGSFQDFISTPKNNGYQSLHTVVIGPAKQKIEIQIRTEEMHEVAEMGLAAHWRYKQKNNSTLDGKYYKWIREILDILKNSSDPEEFLQNTKLAMYYDQVFCFTPKGVLIALPKDATPIDFAYAVHSDIGNHCVGVKINHKVAPLRTKLQNGDQLEIITSEDQTPSPSWEKIAVTGKAKSEIRRFIKNRQRKEYISLGRAILQKALKTSSNRELDKIIEDNLSALRKKSAEEVFYAVGKGNLSREEVLNTIYPGNKSSLISPISFLKKKRKAKTKNSPADNKDSVPIKELTPGLAVHYAHCCHPLPGDKIVGVIHSGKGVTVHTADCEMLANVANNPDKLLDLTWDADKSNTPFIGRIKATLLNEPGSLALLTTEIAESKGNISNFKIINRNSDFFEVILDVEVGGATHISNIITSLRAKPSIHSVERYKI
jgi:GTP pyrophosphokinase